MNIKLSKKFMIFLFLLFISSLALSLWTDKQEDKTIGIVYGLVFTVLVALAFIKFGITIFYMKKGADKKKYIPLFLGFLVFTIYIQYSIFGEEFFKRNPLNTPKYLPDGYRTEYTNRKIGTEEVTFLRKEDHLLSLSKSDQYAWNCNGTIKIILNQEVCWGLKEGSVSEQNDARLKIIWDNDNKTYVISTNDKSLTEQDIVNIIANFP